MSLSCGFYNSLEHDRLYDAIQFTSLFDGIIRDGIFMSVSINGSEANNNRFMVRAGEGMQVLVGSGRAWFNHSWTLNDADYPITIPTAEIALNRYDAVVLEMNDTLAVRENTIKVVQGVPASSPVYPTLTKENGVYQYPLAYVYVRAGTTTITAANITNAVGTSETPYITAVLGTMDIDALMARWEDQWDLWFANETVADQARFNEWLAEKTAELDSWFSSEGSAFNTWFQSLQIILDGDVATHLANEIEKLHGRFEDLEESRALFQTVDGVDSGVVDPITDSNGDAIIGKIVYQIK